MSTLLTKNDYTIGIICALPLERTAVEAMLDVRHSTLPSEPGDQNAYTFGTIGKHNVIIASLGFGGYGTVSASNVANDIRRSFPGIKLGLMVGIAGGVPYAGDEGGGIHLGDVVVACVKGVPSVINFRLGKETGKDFDIRSELAEPPLALQTVVSALEAEYQGSGPTYLVQLQERIGKNPRLNRARLAKDYFNIPNAPDVLYATSDTSSPITRPQRSLRDPPSGLEDAKFISWHTDSHNELWPQYPVIHYGTIASSDTLMKSSTSRDSIHALIKSQRKADILCFEMEAAGIVKNWPCLVIRGICDYADEHKNKAWQNFAAATAAAYARDLLLRLAPEVVQRERRVGDVLSGEGGVSVQSTSGTTYVNSGSGTQRNYLQSGGSGNKQYNAENMTFGSD